VAAGVPSEDAALEAEVLVWANLRGVDSHGVLRIPWYVEMLGKGEMNARPNIRVERETAATLLIDGDRALGPVVTTLAMRRAIDKARTAGVGWAVIRNTTHQGAMAYYALMAANAGMAGIAIVCSPPNMAPFGARVAAVHNSPISIAVPAGRHRFLCVDMATSVAAGGKLSLARDKGIPLPPGWALDDAGQPNDRREPGQDPAAVRRTQGLGARHDVRNAHEPDGGQSAPRTRVRRGARRRPAPAEQRGRRHRHRGVHRSSPSIAPRSIG
jgi:LDH2 family malate/lactate/ureidoglycolate dehydrogenase